MRTRSGHVRIAAVVDYSDWKSRQLWTLVEAACLLSGEEPVEWEGFNPDQKTLRAKIYRDLKDANILATLRFWEKSRRYGSTIGA